jgi:hypothetical protein
VRSSFRSILLALLLLLPLGELTAHALIVAHVPALGDYRAAAQFIRSELQPRDLITSAPDYLDPILRWQLGDRMPLAMAGRHDNAAYERMWVMAIGGARPADAPRGEPELQRSFGEVQVLRYRLAKSAVLFDFVAQWPKAQASLVHDGASQACPLRTGGVPRGGGLGRGVLMPVAKRFECDAHRPWLFVSDVVLEDLDNRPRHCIWQHPQGEEPVVLRFDDVPLGAALVFYGGIYYEHERMREGGPIEAIISVDDVPLATFQHHDGDGFRALRIDTSKLGKATGNVSVAVRAPEPKSRSFCWAATTHSAPGAAQ